MWKEHCYSLYTVSVWFFSHLSLFKLFIECQLCARHCQIACIYPLIFAKVEIIITKVYMLMLRLRKFEHLS